MEKVHLENIIKSFFLGIFIGVILQFNANVTVSTSYRLMLILATGGIGFVIGFITEWLTSIISIKLANPRNYFFINNVIALSVTALIVFLYMVVTGSETESKVEFIPALFIILGIVCAANIVDYIMYRRAQNRLGLIKGLLKEKEQID
ncbi:hypothetical protein [Candidatus Contubernalis alkaliaceticus]|uniref:hypothetical protein n=1 Tax=Candidatus Contubernalis alkaliaceticus TaxID=338645 RepID=UPI001F4C1376|nr:hypothetical protein [Candidatus Contubernalis alkalaceticus]UNC91322.1 hypothetical protein HUE98_03985 [Candidatus Contubernalis alkalaceticus]